MLKTKTVTMLKKKTVITTERSSNSEVDRLVCAALKAANSNSYERCFDILQQLNRLLSVSSVNDFLPHSKAILSLESHKNPKVRHGVDVFLKSWAMKSLSSKGGRKLPTTLSSAKPTLPPMKHSENSRSDRLKKPDVCKTIPATRKMSKCPVLTKNLSEMLELFEIAKKSADVANVKGLLAAKEESSICVETLSLLTQYPISPIATDTKWIMQRLERLTGHKDRKICNSASALLRHWEQSIRDQQNQ